MKRKIELCLLHIILVSIIGCEDSNDTTEISAIPSIALPTLRFADPEPQDVPDTLVLTFQYTDGDGDLGLDHGVEHRNYPYHYASFFQISSLGLKEVVPEFVHIGQGLLPVVSKATVADGALVFPRTKKQPLGESLPPYSCADYSWMQFVIPEDGVAFIDEFSDVLDSVTYNDTQHLLVLDTLYNKMNPDFYNLTIDFLFEQADGSFEHFDWWTEFCESYNARLPVLYDASVRPPYTIETGPFKIGVATKTQGNITYSMMGYGFKFPFAGKRVKLRFSIKDRALNQSNVLETDLIQL